MKFQCGEFIISRSEMYRYRQSKLCLFLLCLFTFLFVVLIGRQAFTKPNVINSRQDELMTQDPIHIARRKEFEKKLFERLKIITPSEAKHRKMDRDPQGIMVHNSKYDGIIGFSNHLLDVFSNAFKSKSFPARILVHLDLKGAPPKISYLKKVLHLIKSFGATGVLVEYEDMFPYSGELAQVAALNAYTKEEIREFYQAVKDKNLEFIPLVQTFGHLEYMLKLESFAYLREVPHFPNTICPTHNQTQYILRMMLDQVIALHPGLNWIHIGCDEVFHLGECQRCQKRLSQLQLTKEKFFLEHVSKIGEYIKKYYDITPIMWDDELRQISIEAIKQSNIGTNMEIMVWWYKPGLLNVLKNELWDKYHACFDGIWMASAFKGADKPNSFITDITPRLDNNKEWLQVFNMYKHAINFRGIALTGWQRFDHFAVLCELLPQAIPSLAIIIKYLLTEKSDHATILDIGNKLGCSGLLNMDLKYIEFLNACSYPGAEALDIAQRLHLMEKDMQTMLSSNYMMGWITKYNRRHKFGNPYAYDIALQDLSMLIYECEGVRKKARRYLANVYETHIIDEWLEVFVDDKCNLLYKLYEDKNVISKINSWPRRPLVSFLNKSEL